MKRNKIVLTTLVGLNLLLLSSMAVTVAWYQKGVSGKVDGIEVTLKTDKDLMISTKADISSFKHDLPYEELDYVSSFSPVSSSFSSSWISKKETKPSFNATYLGFRAAKSGFYSQELYLLSGDNVYAGIDSVNSSFLANEEFNKAAVTDVKKTFPDLSDDEILANLNKINKSLRVSILVPETERYDYKIYDPFKEAETELGGILDSDANHYFDFDVIGPTKQETIYGEVTNLDKVVYDPAPDEDIITKKTLSCFEAHHRAKVELFNKTASLDNGMVIATEDSYGPSSIESALKIKLKRNVPTKIVLSIYVEGWDTDNTNLVRYASFIIGLRFKILGVRGDI